MKQLHMAGRRQVQEVNGGQRRRSQTPIKVIEGVTRERVAPRGGTDESGVRLSLAPTAERSRVISVVGARLRQVVGDMRRNSRSDLGRAVVRRSPLTSPSSRAGAVPAARRLTTSQRWILVGEGRVSRDLLEEIAENEGILPVSVVVSEASRVAARANGMPVGGSIEQLPEVARRLRADQVVIVVDDIGDDLADRAAQLAGEHGLQVQFVESVRGKPHQISELDAMLARGLRATA